MFTNENVLEIKKAYECFEKRCPKKASELEEFLSGLNENEAIAMRFTYAFMPVSDVVSVDKELILSFVRSALKTRETTDWGKKIPIDLFLNFVLFYRINNEQIVSYRDAFYAELYPRVKDKSCKEAALEVNYWCFEKATYRAADERTLSPLGVITGALGRCGEESVLTVAALRSVGIPARQCYVPRWAHCDDNHAWVEAWVDGKWQYLGACEPEAVLNRGWFTAAASKAMLVHAKAFSEKVEGELVTAKTPIFCTINNIRTYGEAKEIEVCVTNKGMPLPDISVRFEIVNYSELFAICTMKTDASGRVKFLTGLGDLYIHITDGKKIMAKKLDVRTESLAEFCFENAISSYTGTEEFEMIPPSEDVSGLEAISEARAAAHDARLAACNKIRGDYEATFYTPETAGEYCKKYSEHCDFFASVLVFAKGNHCEILSFLNDTKFTSQDKYELLSTLREKDYTDISANVLSDYLVSALPYRQKNETALYVSAILAPRVQNEMLLGERSYIQDFFAKANIKFENAKEVWAYISQSIKTMDEYDYPTIVASAKGMLLHKIGSTIGLSVLFVNICRSFGIPARINSINGAKEFFADGEFMEIGEKVVEKNNATLKILNKSGRDLNYFTEISASRLENGVYKTLVFWGVTIKNEFEVPVKSGSFRILMSARQIDGSVLARAYYFDVAENETKAVDVDVRAEELKRKLKNAPLEDTELLSLDGNKTSLYNELTCKNAVVAFADVGKEPTEHLFNEICELAESFNERKINILVVLNEKADAENKTLKKTLALVPEIKLFLAPSKEYLPNLHKLMGVGDERRPFVMATMAHMGLFAFSNYNVGTAATLLKIIDC